jgi:D-beta-D-heptose 7-phosphate kinase/D-beta-D-heptose 1-phosphate adenosyltransferase
MNERRLKQILARMAQQRILVVGDVMLDHFIWGRVARISPEAPVPVVEVTREDSYPGGAANVARNIRALGGGCHLLGVRGADRAGEELSDLLAQRGVETTGLVVDEHRPTTVKTRIIAHRQQVVRFDKERTDPVCDAIARRLLAEFQRALPQVSGVIFEDYAKGTLHQSLFDAMRRRARAAHKITAADPNARQPLQFRGLTVVTPNRREAFAAVGQPYTEPTGRVLDDAVFLDVGRRLLRQWRPANLLVTLGEDGMCLFRPGRTPHHIPTVAQEVFDVSGAGDTVIATLVLAMAAGATAEEAAEISNHAGGIVVGKVGTATCSPDELAASFARH